MSTATVLEIECIDCLEISHHVIPSTLRPGQRPLQAAKAACMKCGDGSIGIVVRHEIGRKKYGKDSA